MGHVLTFGPEKLRRVELFPTWREAVIAAGLTAEG
jgi:hypothetical protein